MPSAVFAAYAAQAAAAVDAVMAEAWQLQPRKPAAEKAAPAVPDDSRPAVAFQATFVDPQAKPDMSNSYDRRQQRRPGEDSGHPRLLLSPAELAARQLASPGFAVRQEDLLVRQADGVTWRVASVFPMAGGTLKLFVNVIG